MLCLRRSRNRADADASEHPTASAIWALCNGDRTVAEMIAYLSSEIGGESVAGDVTATVERFKTAGLVS